MLLIAHRPSSPRAPTGSSALDGGADRRRPRRRPRDAARCAASSRSPACPRRRVALSVALGALAVGFGVALMATAGYLISRAAEQPPILSLTVTIVAVRFFGLARPLARYLERLASHDLALRALGRIRTRFYERIEPLAPGAARGLPARRAARPDGRRRRRAPGALPARARAAARRARRRRGLRRASRRRSCRPPPRSSRSGSSSVGVAVPAARGALSRAARVAARPPPAAS